MLKKPLSDFPGGSVVGSPAAGAADMGLIPGPGRSNMPHSSWAREPQLLKLESLEPATRGYHNKKPMHRNEDPAQPPKNK